MAPTNNIPPKVPQESIFRFYYFSELLKRPICAGKIKDRIGKLSDLVFQLIEPYPQAVGVFIDHGWGKPSEFIPWEKLVRIEDDAIFVQPTPDGSPYPPFKDQPGWLLVNEHLVGKTILDLDGRRVEVVNDVHLLESRGKMAIVHVDVSFNGFLRRIGLRNARWMKDRLISWRYVQPLNLEDAAVSDAVSLSVTRKQVADLPSEDLADVLEELSGREQQAVFQALDSEKAADTLAEAEPRAQRQLIANLRKEKAQGILSEMSVAQLADLFSVLPHDDMLEMMSLLPEDQRRRVGQIVSERESTAQAIMSTQYLAMAKDQQAGAVLAHIRASALPHDVISYVYVIGPEGVLLGVVDLRDLVLARDQQTLGEMMVSPVVSAEAEDTRDDLGELFAKYHFRMVPVVDRQDHLLGVVHYNDIMKGLVTRAKV
jgi:CBS domain-containing protein